MCSTSAPGAGVHGGQVVSHGTPEHVAHDPASITGQYLTGRARNSGAREAAQGQRQEARGGQGDGQQPAERSRPSFPLGKFVCVTGVSGGGKSTLTIETLFKTASMRLNGARQTPAPCETIKGLEHLDKVIDIDQRPIGRTPRSNPATYTGAFTPIRDWFAGLPEAKARGYKPGRFQLQRQGRALRGLSGRRCDQDRDAFSARCLCHLRDLPGRALQSRNAGNTLQRQEHSRRS